MRRILAATLLAGALAGIGACDSTTPPAGTGTAATTTTADTDSEARKVACGTVKAARDASTGRLLDAVVAFGDPSADSQTLQVAAVDASAALKALAPEITKAAGETTDVTLKDKLTKFASAIDGAVAAIAAAGGDRGKLDAVLGTEPFKSSEQMVLDLCFDVWYP